MEERNTILFNKIKEARTKEEKVHLAIEYFESACDMYDDFDDSDIEDSFVYISDVYDEYNLKPGDEGYEFSMAEALDNMYGK